MGFEVWGLGFGVWRLGFGVWGLEFGVWGLGFGISSFGVRVSGFGAGMAARWGVLSAVPVVQGYLAHKKLLSPGPCPGPYGRPRGGCCVL